MDISMYMGYALRVGFANPTEAFRHFYDKGVRFGDIVDDELDSLPLHLYCDCLREGGIIPDALVSMLNIAAFDKNVRKSNISRVKGYIDQMEKLGMTTLMPAPEVEAAHNGDECRKMREILIEALAEIIDYTRGSGITVAIENQSSLRRADSKTEDLLLLLDSVPGLEFVLDAGNFFCVGEDVLTSYELLRSRMVRAHLKDWKINPFGTYVRENISRFDGVALGDGDIPLRELIAMMKKDNRTDKLVLEVNAPNITVEMLDKSADFLKENLGE